MGHLNSSKSKLQVIDGGGYKPSAWLDAPQTIVGLSPDSKTQQMSFRISIEGVRKALEHGHRQPLLDLWALVIGQVPPVNSARVKWHESFSDQQSFGGAHACFRGIKRPVGDDDKGFDVYAYITKPKATFRYSPSLSCVIELTAIPSDLVCVTYVKFDYPYGRPTRAGEQIVSRGVVTHWELVEAANDGSLPIEYETRYRKRMW